MFNTKNQQPKPEYMTTIIDREPTEVMNSAAVKELAKNAGTEKGKQIYALILQHEAKLKAVNAYLSAETIVNQSVTAALISAGFNINNVG